MKFTETFTYPAGVADVYELITDAAFRKKAAESTGALDVDVDVKRAGNGATVTVLRAQPATVPDFIKKFVGETVRVKQVETWSGPDADGNRTGKFSMDIEGQPAGMTGTGKLTNKAGKAEFVVTGDVKVKVPFLGKKIEPFIATVIEKSLRHDVNAGIKKLKPKKA